MNNLLTKPNEEDSVNTTSNTVSFKIKRFEAGNVDNSLAQEQELKNRIDNTPLLALFKEDELKSTIQQIQEAVKTEKDKQIRKEN